MIDIALVAMEAGLSVVPPLEDGSKQPAMEWKAFQKRRAGVRELEHWYSNGVERHGLGLVCGGISGNLEMLEFEGRAVEAGIWAEFKAAVDEAGLLPLLVRIQFGYGERTPSGGIHLLYHCTEAVPGNTKLARRSGPDGQPEVLIETRGEGGYVVVAPSGGPVHPTGQAWTLLAGGFKEIVEISAEERTALITIAHSFDELPPADAIPPERTEHEAASGRPGDDFNERADWARDVLEPAGWTRTGTRGGREHWYRGREGRRGWTSATVSPDGRYLYVFSTSTELPTEVGLSKFRAFALLHHGGRFDEAAGELRKKGYGAQPGGEIRHGTTEAAVPAGATTGPAVLVRKASSIKPRKINFLWRGRIARGKLSAIGGDPGAGKGTLGIDFVSHLSRGAAWPDGETCIQGRSMLLTPEDDAADTIVPRLIAAGADLDQVDLEPMIPGKDGKPRRINLETDAEVLMAHAASAGVVVVVIDPISSYLGAATNSWRDSDMRRILDPLAEAAAAQGIAVVLVAHLTKDSNRRAMYRFQGSIAQVAAARFAFVVAPDPKERERRVMACIKTNLGAMPLSLTFRIVSTRVEVIDEEVGAIEWTGMTALTADELLGPEKKSEALDRAKEFLLEYLAKESMWSEVVKAAAKAKGIGTNSLWAAKEELGVEAVKLGLDGWKWQLPQSASELNRSEASPPDRDASEAGFEPSRSDHDASLRFSSKQPPSSVITDEEQSLFARATETARTDGSAVTSPAPAPEHVCECGGLSRNVEADGSLTCLRCGGKQPR